MPYKEIARFKDSDGEELVVEHSGRYDYGKGISDGYFLFTSPDTDDMAVELHADQVRSLIGLFHRALNSKPIRR